MDLFAPTKVTPEVAEDTLAYLRRALTTPGVDIDHVISSLGNTGNGLGPFWFDWDVNHPQRVRALSLYHHTPSERLLDILYDDIAYPFDPFLHVAHAHDVFLKEASPQRTEILYLSQVLDLLDGYLTDESLDFDAATRNPEIVAAYLNTGGRVVVLDGTDIPYQTAFLALMPSPGLPSAKRFALRLMIRAIWLILAEFLLLYRSASKSRITERVVEVALFWYKTLTTRALIEISGKGLPSAAEIAVMGASTPPASSPATPPAASPASSPATSPAASPASSPATPLALTPLIITPSTSTPIPPSDPAVDLSEPTLYYTAIPMLYANALNATGNFQSFDGVKNAATFINREWSALKTATLPRATLIQAISELYLFLEELLGAVGKAKSRKLSRVRSIQLRDALTPNLAAIRAAHEQQLFEDRGGNKYRLKPTLAYLR